MPASARRQACKQAEDNLMTAGHFKTLGMTCHHCTFGSVRGRMRRGKEIHLRPFGPRRRCQQPTGGTHTSRTSDVCLRVQIEEMKKGCPDDYRRRIVQGRADAEIAPSACEIPRMCEIISHACSPKPHLQNHIMTHVLYPPDDESSFTLKV